MSIIDQVLSRPEFADDPPVLLDIGASGAIHAAWRPLARHSICIAFDPDRRGMHHVSTESHGYRKLVVYPAAVVDRPAHEAEVYLTRSPYCSSLLPPDAQALRPWVFAALFEVVGKDHVKAVDLPAVLAEQQLDRVDWFKTDSQGMDLRLFQSLPEDLRRRVLVAEFEPGFIDAYVGEDKIWQVLRAMDRQEFWLTSFRVHGSHRLSATTLTTLSSFEQRWAPHLLPPAPGWAEMIYLNGFRDFNRFALRDLLLGWVVATLHRQHGCAIELAAQARDRFGDPLFERLWRASIWRMRLAGAKIAQNILRGLWRGFWSRLS